MIDIKRKLYFLRTIILTVILLGLFFWLSAGFQDNINKPDIISTPSPKFSEFHLEIPALNISAPIVSDVDGTNQKAYDKALENGVGQLKGSSKPGEGSNIFIFGHSSYYLWAPGEYKNVFSNLNELKNGDEIIIWFNQKEYKYEVTENKIVSPYEVDIALPTKNEQVTLMTCWPRYTTQKRLVVVGTLK